MKNETCEIAIKYRQNSFERKESAASLATHTEVKRNKLGFSVCKLFILMGN